MQAQDETKKREHPYASSKDTDNTNWKFNHFRHDYLEVGEHKAHNTTFNILNSQVMCKDI